MTPHKLTLQKYMDAFARGDRPAILSCLTDDVEWVLPGAYHLRGIAAFEAEIGNETFVGRPEIAVTRMVEEGDVVVAEGTVRAERRAGGFLHAVFCDVFVFAGARVRHLTSYLLEVKPAEA